MDRFDEDTDFREGAVIPIDKECDWTSFDVVKKIRSLLCRKYGYDKLKVGHAGTLDPLATGLVLVCTGKATRQINELQATEKEYLARVRLGETTPSLDRETEVNGRYPTGHITRDMVEKVLSEMCGDLWQKPPAYSAKWKDGIRAYHLARKGEEPDLEPVRVRIIENELVSCAIPDLAVRIVCGKGTYIRSFARDLGKGLDTGAFLLDLRRTRIGPYRVSDALTIKEFEEKIKYM